MCHSIDGLCSQSWHVHVAQILFVVANGVRGLSLYRYTGCVIIKDKVGLYRTRISKKDPHISVLIVSVDYLTDRGWCCYTVIRI